MFETLVDVFLDALIDSLKILPFLFGVYLLIEYIEHPTSLERLLEKWDLLVR